MLEYVCMDEGLIGDVKLYLQQEVGNLRDIKKSLDEVHHCHIGNTHDPQARQMEIQFGALWKNGSIDLQRVVIDWVEKEPKRVRRQERIPRNKYQRDMSEVLKQLKKVGINTNATKSSELVLAER